MVDQRAPGIEARVVPGRDVDEVRRAGGKATPTCFLHVPKSAGLSILAALKVALPPGSLAPQSFDTSLFCDFNDIEILPPDIRSMIAVGSREIEAMSSYRAIAGHFCLGNLLKLTDARSICTILREPRTRLLSFYMYWRIPDIGELWTPYRPELHALRPLREFLAEPYLAPVIDNQLCRLLLREDPRLPPQGFASPSDVRSIAADAIERLETLGFVGVLEMGHSVWAGVAQMFGVTLQPTRVNVTGEVPPLAAQTDQALVDDDALDLIEQRCGADTIVYDHVLARTGLDDPACLRIKDRAFARELVKLGDLIGYSATQAAERTVAELRAQLNEQECAAARDRADLEKVRHWLHATQTSSSWRMTSPLRAAKRSLEDARGGKLRRVR